MLPSVKLAINNWKAALTRVSPFFLTHGYNIDILELYIELGKDTKGEQLSPIQKANNMIKKLKQVME